MWVLEELYSVLKQITIQANTRTSTASIAEQMIGKKQYKLCFRKIPLEKPNYNLFNVDKKLLHDEVLCVNLVLNKYYNKTLVKKLPVEEKKNSVNSSGKNCKGVSKKVSSATKPCTALVNRKRPFPALQDSGNNSLVKRKPKQDHHFNSQPRNQVASKNANNSNHSSTDSSSESSTESSSESSTESSDNILMKAKVIRFGSSRKASSSESSTSSESDSESCKTFTKSQPARTDSSRKVREYLSSNSDSSCAASNESLKKSQTSKDSKNRMKKLRGY